MVRIWFFGALLLLCSTVHAQGFSSERFEVPMDRSGILNVEGADTSPEGSYGLYLWGGYANDSIVVNKRLGGESRRVGSLVGDSVNGSIGGFYSLSDRTQLRLDLPVSLLMNPDRGELGDVEGLRDGKFGDPKVGAKWKLFDQDGNGFPKWLSDVAFGIDLTLPLSNAGYFSEAGLTAAPYVSFGRWIGSWRGVANIGYKLRKERDLGSLHVDDEVLAKLGAAYGWDRNELGTTLSATTSARGPFEFGNRDYSEAMVGYTRYYYGGLSSFIGVGVGLNEGFGAPDYRMFAGLRWEAESTKGTTVKSGPLGGECCARPAPKIKKEKVPEPCATAKPILVVTNSFFSFNGYDIKDRYKDQLVKTAADILGALKQGADFVLIIQGHTDAVGSNDYNIALGEKRAAAVRQVLIANGVPGEVIRIASYGENRPADTNATALGRARNRRVNIYIVPENAVDWRHPYQEPTDETFDSLGNLKLK